MLRHFFAVLSLICSDQRTKQEKKVSTKGDIRKERLFEKAFEWSRKIMKKLKFYGKPLKDIKYVLKPMRRFLLTTPNLISISQKNEWI